VLNQSLSFQIGGPYWEVPTGRRDGRVSIANEALFNLPSPFANITVLKQQFAATGLSVKDLAVLSGSFRNKKKLSIKQNISVFTWNIFLVTGGHTIGIGHCTIISNRLYNFTGKGDTDPSLDPRYAAQLKKKCKPGNSNTVVEMDPGSFKTFDEDYYTIVAKRRGLFRSDAALLDDAETRDYVKFQSRTQGSTFAQDFAESMVKMGYIGVLTGEQGEIRKRCAVVN
jgi:peroxidase